MTNPTRTARRPLITAAIALAVAALASACQPLQYIDPPVQQPGTVWVGGDSITWTALLDGTYADTGWTVDAYMGWQMSDVTPHYQDALDAGKADTAVFLLGPNDVHDGWDQTDENRWNSALATAGPSCRVVVKPWVETTNDVGDPTWFAYIRPDLDKVRDYIDRVHAVDPTIRVVDWEPLAVQPGVTDQGDGLHLAKPADGDAVPGQTYTTAVSQAARRQIIQQAIDACAS